MLKNYLHKQDLRDYLLQHIDYQEAQYDADELAAESAKETVFAYMMKHYTDNHDLINCLADFSGASIVDLVDFSSISQELLSELPREIINQLLVFPFNYADENHTQLCIATIDPTDKTMLENLEIRTGKTLIPYLTTEDDIKRMISKYFGDAIATEAANKYAETIAPITTQAQANDTTSADSPIVVVVDALIDQAARLNASDIHIEPFEDKLKVRYRIDGSLVERPSFPVSLTASVISRIKIIGGMDISEKRIPQDGRITHIVDGHEYDIRVSILPTVFGEKCVMRLALKEGFNRDKQHLGLNAYDMKLFDKIFAHPHGIILVTGPTGSGKSTTLYTALAELSTSEVNIVTVEDPVEANVIGVNQVQTNNRAGLTFATVLRAILRQDPDIIMVGEIRDEETAKIAVQAAITGHLVVSTLHTNSAADALTRLVSMGVEPYFVADAVIGIIAQRLVRKLCPRCAQKRLATVDEKKMLGLNKDALEKEISIFDPVGCAYCNNTGYAGRTAVYEILDVNSEIRDKISEGTTTTELNKMAVANGMHTLHRSAAELVLHGVTSIQEMKKV